jgi:hypothetical protein
MRAAAEQRSAQARFWSVIAEDEADKAAHFAAQQATIRHRSFAVFLASPIAVLRITSGLLQLLGVTSTALVALYDKAGGHSVERHRSDWPEVLHRMPSARLSHVSTRRAKRKHSGLELMFEARDGRHIFLPIKFVPAAESKTRTDECWANTMYFMRAVDVQARVDGEMIRPVTQAERERAAFAP